MALRAGYYGLKRSLKDKLFNLAASTPADISPDNPIAGKNDVLTSIDLLDQTVGWIGKNLFNGKATSSESQGVKWTVDVNDNNIVTVSGTPTGFEAFTIESKKVLPAGEYVLLGISDMVNVVYNAVILYKGSNQVRDLNIQDDRSAHTISILQSDDYDTIRIQLKRQTNGVACSGTGKLMITTPEQYEFDLSYAPYHASVAETIKNSKPKVATFSGSTSANGNILLSETPRYIIAINCAYCADPYIYSDQQYVHLTDATASYTIPAEGITVTGTYLYYDIPAPENREISADPEVKETKKSTKKKVIKEEE